MWLVDFRGHPFFTSLFTSFFATLFPFFTLLEFLELPTPVAYSGVALSKFTFFTLAWIFSHPFFTSCFTTRFPVYHPP